MLCRQETVSCQETVDIMLGNGHTFFRYIQLKPAGPDSGCEGSILIAGGCLR